MNIVRLSGGLGNQMFQYAFGKNLESITGVQTRYDAEAYRNNKADDLTVARALGLQSLRASFSLVSKEEISAFENEIFVQRNFGYSGAPFRSTSRYFVGSWQSPKYFSSVADKLYLEFSSSSAMPLATQELRNSIIQNRGLCLNVRRGDFAHNPQSNAFHGLLSSEYYTKGVTTLRSKGDFEHVFVFSDDPDWCRSNLKLEGTVQIVGHDHAGPHFSHYLELMKACSAFVIPNSTFGWWAAWLSRVPEENVIAPKRWFRRRLIRTSDLFPDRWIRITDPHHSPFRFK
jgi:hypothetical protein